MDSLRTMADIESQKTPVADGEAKSRERLMSEIAAVTDPMHPAHKLHTEYHPDPLVAYKAAEKIQSHIRKRRYRKEAKQPPFVTSHATLVGRRIRRCASRGET